MGSLVAGDPEFIDAARRVRKALGGGMRQVGVLAAAGLLALAEGPGLVARDHERAATMAEAFASLPGIRLDPVESNILMLNLEDREPADLLEFLAARAIRALPVGPRRVRLVTHRDLNDEHVERCIAAVTSWAAQRHQG